MLHYNIIILSLGRVYRVRNNTVYWDNKFIVRLLNSLRDHASVVYLNVRIL